MTRPEEQGARVIWIDRKAFAQASSILVAAHAERHGDYGPGRSTIAAAQDRGGLVRIHPGRKIDDIGIARVGGEALDSEVIALPQRVLQRDPALLLCVPAIGAPDVGTEIG